MLISIWQSVEPLASHGMAILLQHLGSQQRAQGECSGIWSATQPGAISTGAPDRRLTGAARPALAGASDIIDFGIPQFDLSMRPRAARNRQLLTGMVVLCAPENCCSVRLVST